MAKRAAIVGAGVGGLTTALRLLRNGWEVDVYEKNMRAGGRLGRIEGGGFKFDLGPTIVLMPDVFYRLFADLGRRLEDYLELRPLEPNYRLHFADGSYLDSTSNLQRMMQEIERLAPSDLDGFMRYLAWMQRRYRVARYDFIEEPMLTMKELVDLRKLWKLYGLHTVQTMNRDVRRFIKDPRLQTALTFQSLYIGIDPFEAPAIYNVIGYMELSYSGVWYCKGGYYSVTEALVRLLEEMGGRLHLGTPVETVEVEGGRAVGVRVRGQLQSADAVVVGADFPLAAKRLVPASARPDYSDARIDKMEQSCSAFMMYLGVDQSYRHADVHNVYFSRDFQGFTDDVFRRKVLPNDPSFYVHLPNLIDDSVAPPGKQGIYVLVPVPNKTAPIDWAKEKKPFRDAMIQRLQRVGFRDLEKHLEFEAIYTPDTWEASLGLAEGAAFGVMPRLRQSAYWRPSLKSKTVSGLYFVGASTHPGGGVPIVMTGARTIERIMSEDYPGYLPNAHQTSKDLPTWSDRRHLAHDFAAFTEQG